MLYGTKLVPSSGFTPMACYCYVYGHPNDLKEWFWNLYIVNSNSSICKVTGLPGNTSEYTITKGSHVGHTDQKRWIQISARGAFSQNPFPCWRRKGKQMKGSYLLFLASQNIFLHGLLLCDLNSRSSFLCNVDNGWPLSIFYILSSPWSTHVLCFGFLLV